MTGSRILSTFCILILKVHSVELNNSFFSTTEKINYNELEEIELNQILDTNWVTDCTYTSMAELNETIFDKHSTLQFNENFLSEDDSFDDEEVIKDTENDGYWTLNSNNEKRHCSIMNTNITDLQNWNNLTLKTFLLRENSFILVTVLKTNIYYTAKINSSYNWITKLGWTETIISMKTPTEIYLSIIISIFNYNQQQGFVLVKDFRETSQPVDNVTNSDAPYRSMSLGQMMREVNIYAITAVVSLIGILMIVVVIVTCIQRRCPPCSKNVHLLEDDEDEIDDDSLLDDLFDRKLKFGLNQYDEKQEHQEPIFFSTKQQPTFGISGKPVPRFYNMDQKQVQNADMMAKVGFSSELAEFMKVAQGGSQNGVKNENRTSPKIQTTTSTEDEQQNRGYYLGFLQANSNSQDTEY